MINLGVIFGGKSVEHDISILSYFHVLHSLNLKEYNIIPIYMDKENRMSTSKDYLNLDTFKSRKKVRKKDIIFLNSKKCSFIKLKFKKIKIDFCLVVVHGKDLEDGTIRGFLKIMNVANNLLPVEISSVLHDKYFCKLALKDLNIPVLKSSLVTKNISYNNKYDQKIMKCCKLGSSIGVYKIDSYEQYLQALNTCFKYDNKVIIEERLMNYEEYNQAVYLKGNDVKLSAIEQIKSVDEDLYSFDKKYQNGEVNRKVSPDISSDLEQEINKISEKIAKHFNITSVIRIDYIFDLDSLKLYVNEINVIPGSLSYYLFENKGIYFNNLLDDIIENGFRRCYFENNEINSFESNVLNIVRINKTK